jgi:hypothetical protein
MSDAPSERAIWNVKTLVNFMILLAYFILLYVGVTTDEITVTAALGMIGSAALGGGIGWAMK